MWQRNSGSGENDLQNRFTAYLVLSINRKRRNYAFKKYNQYQHEISFDETLEPIAQQEFLEGLPLMSRIENEALCYALDKLNEREWKVFISRVLDEKNFKDLGKELGLGYKGVAAVYYRAIQKIKRNMEEKKRDEF